MPLSAPRPPPRKHLALLALVSAAATTLTTRVACSATRDALPHAPAHDLVRTRSPSPSLLEPTLPREPLSPDPDAPPAATSLSTAALPAPPAPAPSATPASAPRPPAPLLPLSPATLEGLVVDVNGPVAGMRVAAVSALTGDAAPSAITDVDGYYSFTARPGRYTVHAGGWNARVVKDWPEVRVANVLLEPGDHRRVDFALPLGATFLARVRRADGTPARGAKVWAASLDEVYELGECEPDGTFLLLSVAPGTLRIRATTDDEATLASPPVTFVANEQFELDLELIPATRVHVRWLDPQDAPADTELEVLDSHGERLVLQPASSTDWLPPLAPGLYHVRAQRGLGAAERIVSLDGDHPIFELVLRVPAAPRASPRR